MLKKKMHIKKITTLILAFVMVILSLAGCGSMAENTETAQYTARDTLRIGCIIGEEYYYFQDELCSMAKELTARGVLKGFDTEAEYESSEEVWKALTEVTCEGDTQYIFSEKDFYNYDLMSDKEMEAVLKVDSVDVMLVLGTAAGKFLTAHADEIGYDYMVFASMDPVSAGIVPDADGRYNDHAYAQVDPNRVKRQIEGAYEIFKFKDIGVVYEDNESAYSYSGIAQLEAKSKEYGFNIHTRHVVESSGGDDDKRYFKDLKAAYDELLPEIDSLYITTATIDSTWLPELLADLHKAGVVTIAETSVDQVEYGALMHISVTDPWEEGQFLAQVMSDYAGGMPITEIPQRFETAPKVYFNSDTIDITGTSLPFEEYLVADHIYSARED